MTEKRFQFTKAQIDSIKTPKKRTMFHDVTVPELGLMSQPTGGKAFFWFRWAGDKPVYKSIGKYPDVTIENARNKAREYSAALGVWKLGGFQGDSPFGKKLSLRSFH